MFCKRQLFRAIVSLFVALFFAGMLPSTVLAITPSNDRIDNALEIAALPFLDERDTSDATTSTSDPNCFGQARTVWYRWIAPKEMDVAASTVGSSYDTNLAVYRMEEGGQLASEGCNDDARGAKTSRVRFIAFSGVEYLIRVGGTTEPSGGSLVFRVEELFPPANDQFENAVQVNAFPFEDTRDVSEASASSQDPTCQQKLRTVWYAISIDATDIEVGGRLRITPAGSDYRAVVSVWSGTYGSFGSPIACTEGPVTFTPQLNQTYYVVVSSATIEAGVLHLLIERLSPLAPAPPNDKFESATSVGPLDPIWETVVNTDQATVDSNDPVCVIPSRTVWFEFSPDASDLTRSRVVRIDTSESDYDAAVSVYQGGPSAFSTVLCDPSDPSTATFEAIEGDKYFILVEARSSTEPNNLVMKVENLSPQSVPPTLDLRINPAGFRSLLTGAAALQGNVTCTEPLDIKVTATLSQGSRQATASRFMRCPGSKAWSLNLFGDFNKGDGFAEVTVEATGDLADLVDPRTEFEHVDLVECTQIGTSKRDRMRGTKRKDRLCGLAGDDKLIGRDGDDWLFGGAGEDVLRAGEGDDHLRGGDDGDSLFGGPGNDDCLPGGGAFNEQTDSCERIHYKVVSRPRTPERVPI